ncbi:GNAT family N-acetyltransferase [Micromonospora sp. WMMA2032]|uniref:GNAT family N-acetyltransferase n=1 Tax=Micromonospora sp. WMMA2032 TaxID=2039870 RepID=UPI000C05C95C|nr:GNAT family N-acetyltransferase [Micromonospora sp. WMMA2032]ATO12918.1 GNAT family N-acetyltransferase [Micromonospora sp. WMMA2032]
MTAAPTLHFHADPGEFLAVAGDHLAADPVVGTVVASVTNRAAVRRADGVATPDGDWWLVVRDARGAVVGVGMRAAPFPPRPPFLLPMPTEAAVALARTWHERGEEVTAVNGALPAARECAAEVARLGGGRVEVAQHTRLHELDELVPPASTPGALRVAAEDDVDLVAAWFDAFMADADEQAGRARGASAHETPDREELLRRIRGGRVWLWTDPAGRPVHLTAANPTSFGVARVGPVYTPPQQRGRGWAAAAVAEVSRLLRAEGARVCLYTDQANPTSNRLYARLGFRPVVDMANLVVVR